MISGLQVSIDFAATGDFEARNDTHIFEVPIDGSPPTPIFTSSIDEDGSQNYAMASGTPVTLDDPMLMNGTPLDNSFNTLTEPLVDIGNILTLLAYAWRRRRRW